MNKCLWEHGFFSKTLFFFLLIFPVASLFAEEALQYKCPDESDKPRLTWSGFIETEAWGDTRQVVTKRNGNELLFPKPKKFDLNGCDINDHPDFGIIPFVVRLMGRLDGPALFCTDKTYAFFSGDFRGISDSVSPVFRFRKGYVKFDWGCTALLIGQDDHPMYISDCKPNTVAYSRAAPIDTRARVPQIRFIWRPEISDDGPKDEIWYTLYSHARNARSDGPIGGSTSYIQDGVMPAMDLQWRKYLADDTFWGIGANFKRIVPRLSTTNMDFKDTKGITSGIVYTYFAHLTPCFALRTKLLYVHDGQDLGLISGYAVKCQDPVTKKRTYANLRSFSYWMDIDLFPKSQISPGILLAVGRNLGSDQRLFRDPEDNDDLITYALAPNIRLLARVAPRVWYKCGPVAFGAELEWTYAEYGILNDFGEANITTKPENPDFGDQPKPVGNVRFLGAIFYYF